MLLRILKKSPLTLKIFLASLLILPSQIAFAAAGISVSSIDTVAGSPTILKAVNLLPDSLINFVVEKPDGLVLTLPATADENGKAEAEIYDYHTRMAGQYHFYAYQKQGTVYSHKSSFIVYPGEINQAESEVTANQNLIKADGQDQALIEVKLMDQYQNPIAGRALKLVSSRLNDNIAPLSAISDGEGKVNFTVASLEKGIGYYSVIDKTEDLTLNQRIKLSFIDNDQYLPNAGGDLIKTAYAAEVGPLAGFELADFPDNVKPNQNITFKVKAVDATNQVVQDYTGTIRFSAEGDNSSGVTLPANYKFLAEDLGQHQFSLGLSFNSEGTYKIIVNDVTDKFKQGEKTVVVSNSSSSTTTTTTTGEKIILSTPAAGSYSQAQQTVSGKAKGNSNVKIYDNDQEIGSVVVNISGKFSFQTPALKDGKHSIHVVAFDNISSEVIGTSDPVEIFIDTTPPKIDEVRLDPTKDIKAGSVINVTVFSEAKLSQAALIFNSDIIPLNASIDDETAYVGTLQAPAEAGAYGLNVLVADELQNEKTYENVATINVDPAGGSIENNLPANPDNKTPTENQIPTDNQNKDNTNVEKEVPPSQVSGLIAYGSDKRVTLVWDAAVGAKTIAKYKVYYGDDVKNLAQNVMTKDASTTWYIPNLENGKEYFFAVSAIDESGVESESRSEIVSGIPFMLEINNALTGGPEKPLDSGLKPAAYNGPYPPNSSKTGPELLWLLVPSMGLAGIFRKKF